ncbi:MAG: CAP domain-containing protein [Thaumarchaeota archaeon]|nr:CAP domain-containing protein [Nitrososphaerota archaeon]
MGKWDSENDWINANEYHATSNHFNKWSKKRTFIVVLLLGIVFVFATSPDLFFELLESTTSEIEKIISENELLSTIWKNTKIGISDVEEISDGMISEIWNNVKSVTSEIKVPVPVNVNQRLESGFDEKIIEQYIYDFTNDERQVRGLSILSKDSTIIEIAKSHSLDMSERDYFEHDTPEGLDPTDRGIRAGFECRRDYGSFYTYGLAENIALNYTYSTYRISGDKSTYDWLENEEELAKDIVVGWMNSPGHRENILKDTYERIGIGVIINDAEEVYSTQNFC